MTDTSTPDSNESRAISMTLPAVVIRAMERKGAPFNLGAGEWLKQQVLASTWGADIVLRLQPVIADILAEISDRSKVAKVGESNDLSLES